MHTLDCFSEQGVCAWLGQVLYVRIPSKAMVWAELSCKGSTEHGPMLLPPTPTPTPPGSVVRIPYGCGQLLDTKPPTPCSLLAMGLLYLFACGLFQHGGMIQPILVDWSVESH